MSCLIEIEGRGSWRSGIISSDLPRHSISYLLPAFKLNFQAGSSGQKRQQVDTFPAGIFVIGLRSDFVPLSGTAYVPRDFSVAALRARGSILAESHGGA